MRNIHIYPSTFTHESRILKEAATLSSRLGMNEIFLVGVAAAGLPRTQSISEAIVIHRLGPAKGRGVMKVVRHLLWCLHVLWFCFRRWPDVINCHSLPVLPIGLLVKWLTRARLVYDAHELETETTQLRGRAKSLAKVIERVCMRWVDLLIVVSPGIERWYRDHLNPRGVVTVLNAPPYSAAPERLDLFRKAFPITADERVVLYQGHLAPHRGIEELVAAVPELRKHGFRVVLMGYGPLEATLTQQAREQDFFVHPAVGQDTLLQHTASADIGVLLIQDTCLSYHLCLPNKLFEYAMARIPVLASNFPEVAEIIIKYPIGFCIDSYDSLSISESLQKIDNIERNRLRDSLEEVAKNYNWSSQEEVLIAAYKRHVMPALS